MNLSRISLRTWGEFSSDCEAERILQQGGWTNEQGSGHPAPDWRAETVGRIKFGEPQD